MLRKRNARQNRQSGPILPEGYVPSVVEMMEQRRLFAFATLDSAGLLTVNGTSGADTITVKLNPSNSAQVQVIMTTQGAGTQTLNFTKSQALSLSINADGPNITDASPGGNDFVEVDIAFPGGSSEQNGPVIIGGGAGNDTILGSPSDDIIFGDLGNDSINGLDGNDTISGGAGDDTLRGGLGNDLVNGDDGNDYEVGGQGSDTVTGGAGDDSVRGAKGDDQVNGNDGYDLVIGGPGNDNCDGGTNADTIFGGAGNDTLTGGAGADVVAGDNELSLIPFGDFPADSTPGNDFIAGGANNDTVISGAGSDTVNGVLGADLFEIYNGVTPASTDFNASQGDVRTSDRVFSGSPAVTKTINLKIQVVENGQPPKAVPIPSTAGTFSGGTSIARVTSAASDGSGNSVTFSSNNAGQTFTLGDFFAQWGINLNAFGLGRYANRGSGGLLSMTVNGVNNASFDQYAIQGGETIVITAISNVQ